MFSKIQNYVTITTTSDKIMFNNLKNKKIVKLNEDNENAHQQILKKITSLNIPKKSCDFERFADLIKSGSHTATSSIDDGTLSDNEKLSDFSNDLTQSPEFS